MLSSSLGSSSQSLAKVTSVIPENNVIRLKLSAILMRQRGPQHAHTHLRERPYSISSISLSCPNSPQSPGSQSPQSTDCAVYRQSSRRWAQLQQRPLRAAGRASIRPRLHLHSADGAAVVAIDDPGASYMTVPDTATPTVASRGKKTHRVMAMTRHSHGDSFKASTGANCSIR